MGSWSKAYPSNSAQNAVPHDGGHVVHELDGSCPGIHASCFNVFHRRVVAVMQLKIVTFVNHVCTESKAKSELDQRECHEAI